MLCFLIATKENSGQDEQEYCSDRNGYTSIGVDEHEDHDHNK